MKEKDCSKCSKRFYKEGYEDGLKEGLKYANEMLLTFIDEYQDQIDRFLSLEGD